MCPRYEGKPKHTTEIPMSVDLSEYAGSLNAFVYLRKANASAACGDYYWLFALAAWYSRKLRIRNRVLVVSASAVPWAPFTLLMR